MDTVRCQGRDVSFECFDRYPADVREGRGAVCQQRPLARCSIIGQLRRLTVGDSPQLPAASNNDKMAALFDEGDEAEKVATPKVKKP